eukprot:4392956-Amphidinium_carterae.1
MMVRAIFSASSVGGGVVNLLLLLLLLQLTSLSREMGRVAGAESPVLHGQCPPSNQSPNATFISPFFMTRRIGLLFGVKGN